MASGWPLRSKMLAARRGNRYLLFLLPAAFSAYFVAQQP